MYALVLKFVTHRFYLLHLKTQWRSYIEWGFLILIPTYVSLWSNINNSWDIKHLELPIIIRCNLNWEFKTILPSLHHQRIEVVIYNLRTQYVIYVYSPFSPLTANLSLTEMCLFHLVWIWKPPVYFSVFT